MIYSFDLHLSLNNQSEVSDSNTLEHIFIFCFAYIVLATIFYFYNFPKSKTKFSEKIQRALFVTAHPDDESMFFGPTIINLTKNKDCKVYLLCLSIGNFEGKGLIRKDELWKACETLGISSSNIVLLNYERLPDDPNKEWSEQLIGKIVLKYIESYKIDVLITFDRDGISKHSNHKKIFYGVAYLFVTKQLPDYCQIYTLETVNLFRKYWFFLDTPLSYIFTSARFILSWKDRNQVVKSMCQHKSQMVWFRKLFLIFSRYVIINTLFKMDSVSLELDLNDDF